MSTVQNVGSLLDKITQDKKGKDYLIYRNWDGIDQEKLAAYFVSIRPSYQSIKRVLQFIGGIIIFLKSPVSRSQEIYHSISFAKGLLNETNENIKSIYVPRGLKEQHGQILSAVYLLNKIYKDYVLEERYIYMKDIQIDDVLQILKKAHQHMKNATSYQMGLEMVSLDSCCASGKK